MPSDNMTDFECFYYLPRMSSCSN